MVKSADLETGCYWKGICSSKEERGVPSHTEPWGKAPELVEKQKWDGSRGVGKSIVTSVEGQVSKEAGLLVL